MIVAREPHTSRPAPTHATPDLPPAHVPRPAAPAHEPHLVEPAAAGPWITRRGLLLALALAAGYLLFVFLDRPAFKYFFVGLAQIDKLEEGDGYRLLRIAGSLWSWAAIALGLLAHDWGAGRHPPALALGTPPPAWRFGALSRGLIVFASPVVAGLFAEAAKRLVGRLRPIETDGYYAYAGSFSALLDPPNGIASSHTAVAFGGALALMSLFPRTGWVLLPGAAGCAFTRIISGAHFLTDVYAGALLGVLAASLVISVASARRRP